jgi:hypothetical protein
VTVDAAQERLQAIRDQLAPPWPESEERTIDTGSMQIVVRRRGHRYYLDDRGASVARARALGASGDWLGIAEDVVAQEGFNVNRTGVVFVSAVEGRRDLASLTVRLADCAESVHAALLDAD